jgi:adenosylcobyric acid synthase
MSILFLGTSSGAGKTTVCAMVCRYMGRKGVDIAPFKGSNLSLNSIATRDGGEIGIGQAFQAWAAGIEPETDMNPCLLKPSGNGVMQLVLNGRPYADISKDRPMDRELVLGEVKKAYERMVSKHEMVLCEGSGSPVELNLMSTDIANTGLMRATGVPAILVGDIERGGVFAAIYGTWKLIPDELKPQMKGFIINRFRGDGSILGPAISRIEDLTGMKCLGVLRYEYLRFPEEDSLSSSDGKLEGNDVHSAFIANLDEMISHAEADGFDFDALEKMCGLRSSARCDPEGLDHGPALDDGIHGNGFPVDKIKIRIGMETIRGDSLLNGHSILRRDFLSRDQDHSHVSWTSFSV